MGGVNGGEQRSLAASAAVAMIAYVVSINHKQIMFSVENVQGPS